MGRKGISSATRRVTLIAALSASLVLVTGSAASATNSCTTGIAPSTPGWQSGLRVACLLDLVPTPASPTPDPNITVLEVHDALNAVWHRGAARLAATGVTSGLNTLTGGLVAEDVGRPISGTGIAGGAFIGTVSGVNGTMSQNATATSAGTTKKLIEHTTSRVLMDAIVATAAPKHLKSATAKFVAADLGKSVSGGAFPPGAKITAVGVDGASTYATVSPAPTAASTADTISIGGTQYAGASPTYTETYHRQLVKTTGVTCAAGVLTMVNTAVNGNFEPADKSLLVTFLNAGAAAGTRTISAQTTTTATLSPLTCPTTWTHVAIGEAGGNAPKNGDVVSSLAFSMNLNPAYGGPVDDCNKNTYEGAEMIGRWYNPGSYVTAFMLPHTAPARSTAQIVFPTAIFSFASYVVPMSTDAKQAGKHFDFIFPYLPTTGGACPIVAGTTTTKQWFSLGFTANVATPSPALPASSGNPSAPALRAIGPQTGLFGQKIVLASAASPAGTTLAPTGCTVAASTAIPSSTCGDG